MAYVVCEPCHDCKYTDCVAICPCDCFYEDEWQLYIDADHCIDCDACRAECPVEAIFPDVEVPAKWSNYVNLNVERVRAISTGGHITERRFPKLGPGCAVK